VGDTRCHLAKRSELAGLDQAFLGPTALAHFALQLGVGADQIGRALCHPPLEGVVGTFESFLRSQTSRYGAAALVCV